MIGTVPTQSVSPASKIYNMSQRFVEKVPKYKHFHILNDLYTSVINIFHDEGSSPKIDLTTRGLARQRSAPLTINSQRVINQVN